MKKIACFCFFFIFLLVNREANSQQKSGIIDFKEIHRPQFHFTPVSKWMNDPNGMVFYKGVFHLFYQYYPEASVWGPMHWGHATSKDLIHWEHKPIALFPDSLGYIFSGSAVVDVNNTTGFANNGETPLVAIFTHHDPAGEKEKRIDFQKQSLAYSLDEGKTWVKYEGNPVIENPGIIDFRDPKVMWYEKDKKWLMTLATKDKITFYSSPNLKTWKKESDFGENVGAHGGVWECPDLFQLELNGKSEWVLLVSINPGGPNGGSATQYFTGDFDGSKFTPHSTETKWLDWGTDNYAGVTWSNTAKRKIFIGWMSNWQYANLVPTDPWRSAMTIPRELSLKKVNNSFYLASAPVKELDKIVSSVIKVPASTLQENMNLSEVIKDFKGQFQLKLSSDQPEDFSILIANDLGEELIIGYDKQAGQYFIDRSKAGKKDFEAGFAKKHTAPRLAASNSMDLTVVFDAASVELFADKGLTVMTDIFFPVQTMNKLFLKFSPGMKPNNLSLSKIEGIWK
ncbi:glycoside hydrolase family 32 protein [Daejeonella oryzae]|uniref:glycoside hydrolase family 32 protein n=1 Tax=Daejeonella oryzae TaxID=1122943 RepID=UPI000408F513|nr:glycoside hydrolase family 32 protein [Daejeonella oryzae]